MRNRGRGMVHRRPEHAENMTQRGEHTAEHGAQAPEQAENLTQGGDHAAGHEAQEAEHGTNTAQREAHTYADRPLPERALLLPGVWRLPLPLRDSPLGHVNTYLIRADDGYLLVDCGWDTADTLRTLEGHLRALDVRMRDVRHLVITHIHPDHYGLAGRLREITSADLSFHRLERLFIESRYVDADELLGEMREWLRLNGTPPDELDRLNRGSMSMMGRVQIAFP